MKKFKKIFYLVISVCVCAVLVFASGCSSPPLTGNLFDEKVLERAQIPFLLKPENPINETFGVDNRYYTYDCYSYSYEDLMNYAEEQFNKIVSAGHSTAYFVKLINTGDLLTVGETYILLKESIDFDNFRIDYEELSWHEIYYSTEKLTELTDTEGRGLKFDCYYISFGVKTKPNENGLYHLHIGLGTNKNTDYYILTD